MTSRTPTQTILSFSGGKDSCLALQALRQDPSVEVVGLLTTIGVPYQRVSHHGVRRELLIAQAESIGLPLHVIELEASMADCTAMTSYENKMAMMMSSFLADGIEAIAFGDLFLEDLRAYREKKNRQAGMRSLFPVWGQDTQALAERFIADGFRAVLTCVDTDKLDASFAGRAFDQALLIDIAQLPVGLGAREAPRASGDPGAQRAVDPCGEYGEFHSFVWDGPVFKTPINWSLGERLTDKNRAFIDVLPLKAEDKPAIAAEAQAPLGAEPPTEVGSLPGVGVGVGVGDGN